MFTTIITDCFDSNAATRQMTRAASILGFSPILVAIEGEFDSPSDLEASGHLIDTLDACRGSDGIVLINKAPRSGKAKKWKNGTPFGYFWYNKTLVVSSIDGYALSLIKKFKLADKINVFDIPTVMKFAKDNNLLDEFDADYVVTTQFRSYEFLPRVAKWVYDKHNVPAEEMDIQTEVIDAPQAVWFTDNFGNLKTTILPNEIDFEAGKVIDLEGFGKLVCYNRLKDLPNKETGLIVGSSGLKDRRFIEIMTQGSSTKNKFGVSIGKEIKISS